MGLTLNGGYGGGGGSYPTLEVTITNGTATSVTATLGSTVVNLTYDSTAGVWRGTLKAFGTWTVEASNGEKTVSDTVDVTNLAVYTASLTFGPLPSGYTQLEYIESTGTQYINTGVVPTANTQKISVEAQSLSTQNRQCLFYGGSSPTPCGLWSNDAGASAGFQWDTGWQTLSVALTERHLFVIDFPNNYLSVDGVTLLTSLNYGTTGFTNPFCIGAGGYQSPPTERITAMKLWSFSIDENGQASRDFIPARRNSDLVVGLYDLVTNTFYTNAGSGSFIAGPEV